jgi:hypothetical protein
VPAPTTPTGNTKEPADCPDANVHAKGPLINEDVDSPLIAKGDVVVIVSKLMAVVVRTPAVNVSVPVGLAIVVACVKLTPVPPVPEVLFIVKFPVIAAGK